MKEFLLAVSGSSLRQGRGISFSVDSLSVVRSCWWKALSREETQSLIHVLTDGEGGWELERGRGRGEKGGEY